MQAQILPRYLIRVNVTRCSQSAAIECDNFEPISDGDTTPNPQLATEAITGATCIYRH